MNMNTAKIFNLAMEAGAAGVTIASAMVAAYGIKDILLLQAIAEERPLTEEESEMLTKATYRMFFGSIGCMGGASILGSAIANEYQFGRADAINDIRAGRLVVMPKNPAMIPTLYSQPYPCACHPVDIQKGVECNESGK